MTDKKNYNIGVEVNMRTDSSAQLKTPKSHVQKIDASSPFSITILGDFSGRENNAVLSTR